MDAFPAIYQHENSGSDTIIDRRYYQNFTFYAHFHANPELVYVSDGELDLIIDGSCERAHAGQYCMILPWQVHSFATPESSQALVLVFPEKYIVPFAQTMSSCHGESQVFCAEPSVHELFMRYLFDGSCPDEYLFSSILLGLCHSFASSCRIVPNSDRKKTAVLVRMMNYISEHYQEELSLKDVSSALGYNYYYLSHLFRETTTLTFHEFCSIRRIEHARNLLLSGTKPVTEIADECGFSCVRSFNRAFLRHSGMSPTEYRRSQKSNSSATVVPILFSSLQT